MQNLALTKRILLIAGLIVYLLVASFLAEFLLNFLLYPVVGLIQLLFQRIDEKLLVDIHTYLILAISTAVVGISAEAIWHHYMGGRNRIAQVAIFTLLALASSAYVKCIWLENC